MRFCIFRGGLESGLRRWLARSVCKNSPLLLGGLTQREHFEKGYDAGFGFFDMGRALLREPDMIKKIEANPNYRTLCDHNNFCMASVFGRTHCIYSPEYAQSPEDRQIRPEGTSSATESMYVNMTDKQKKQYGMK